MYFSFNSGWYSIHLGTVRKEQRGGIGGEVLRNRGNLSIVTKCICPQSLIYIYSGNKKVRL